MNKDNCIFKTMRAIEVIDNYEYSQGYGSRYQAEQYLMKWWEEHVNETRKSLADHKK